MKKSCIELTDGEKAWLLMHGGRTLIDVQIDPEGKKFIYMRGKDGVRVRVYVSEVKSDSENFAQRAIIKSLKIARGRPRIKNKQVPEELNKEAIDKFVNDL